MVLDVLLFSIPEALAVAWLAQILSGAKLFWAKTVSVGVLTGATAAVLRPSMGSFLLNMTMYAIVLTFYFSIFKTATLWKLVVSVAFAMSIYLLTEFVNFFIIQNAFHINPTVFFDNLTFKFMCFLPQLIATILISLLFTKSKVNLFVDNLDSKEV